MAYCTLLLVSQNLQCITITLSAVSISTEHQGHFICTSITQMYISEAQTLLWFLMWGIMHFNQMYIAGCSGSEDEAVCTGEMRGKAASPTVSGLS